MINQQPTIEAYEQLQHAYNVFNKTLFNGRLPDCMIIFNRRKNRKGHFWAQTWQDTRTTDVIKAEIALNPDYVSQQTERDALSTLVHEMCHLEQHYFGKPSRNGYHNKQWGSMMKDVGLYPSNTGEPGGKETGQQMTHYILEDGAFAAVYADIKADGFSLTWGSNVAVTQEPKKPKKKDGRTKIKYVCPHCDIEVHSKTEINILCEDCDVKMINEKDL